RLLPQVVNNSGYFGGRALDFNGYPLGSCDLRLGHKREPIVLWKIRNQTNTAIGLPDQDCAGNAQQGEAKVSLSSAAFSRAIVRRGGCRVQIRPICPAVILPPNPS